LLHDPTGDLNFLPVPDIALVIAAVATYAWYSLLYQLKEKAGRQLRKTGIAIKRSSAGF
jgi:hypothetical protein